MIETSKRFTDRTLRTLPMTLKPRRRMRNQSGGVRHGKEDDAGRDGDQTLFHHRARSLTRLFYVCTVCPKHRERCAAANGRTIGEEWALPIVIRTRRASPFPKSRVDSAAAARKLIEEDEARLIADVKAAEAAKRAKQKAKSFGDIADAYCRYQLAEGKRYDRARFIEALVGRERDAYAIDITIYREVLAEIAQLGPQTRRHYASTLLAMMNNAKADGIITHHPVGDMRLPTVNKSDDPVIWTRKHSRSLPVPPSINGTASRPRGVHVE